MKQFSSWSPIVTEALSGAYGGAVIGDAIGGERWVVAASQAGACILIISNIARLRDEKGKITKRVS